MSIRGMRSLIALLGVVSVLLLGIQPVLADTERGHSGTVGAHSLNDSMGDPGATCKYKYNSYYQAGRLKHIYVDPPNIMAVAGKSAQTVGWTFTVQRRIYSVFGPPSVWSNRYTSPEMTDVTSDSANASFSAADVSVDTPFGPGTEDAFAVYRVMVNMYWHRANGSVQGNAKHRVDFYYSYYKNHAGSDVQEDVCGGIWAPDPARQT